MTCLQRFSIAATTQSTWRKRSLSYRSLIWSSTSRSILQGSYRQVSQIFGYSMENRSKPWPDIRYIRSHPKPWRRFRFLTVTSLLSTTSSADQLTSAILSSHLSREMGHVSTGMKSAKKHSEVWKLTSCLLYSSPSPFSMKCFFSILQCQTPQ